MAAQDVRGAVLEVRVGMEQDVDRDDRVVCGAFLRRFHDGPGPDGAGGEVGMELPLGRDGTRVDECADPRRELGIEPGGQRREERVASEVAEEADSRSIESRALGVGQRPGEVQDDALGVVPGAQLRDLRPQHLAVERAWRLRTAGPPDHVGQHRRCSQQRCRSSRRDGRQSKHTSSRETNESCM